LRLTCTADGATRLEYACSLEMGGHLPKWLVNNVAVPALMRMPSTIQQYFAHVKLAATCTAKDGVLLGHLLAETSEEARPLVIASAVASFVVMTTVFRECGFFFLDAMPL
jgi:hypothetical protein